ncbi:hypothetical protein GCM10012280_65130 [Wenjunlia tyrosinilytica]|uniref:Uncharacterized protein n=1 Tax=Wenjunlia tyrosinilytica TaxID=1544741 RepID=A0A918E1Y7_9ACTN|nr:hypothetical protein GCM10012280_65130 [Wenjunlia tyrosinilytica]
MKDGTKNADRSPLMTCFPHPGCDAALSGPEKKQVQTATEASGLGPGGMPRDLKSGLLAAAKTGAEVTATPLSGTCAVAP